MIRSLSFTKAVELHHQIVDLSPRALVCAMDHTPVKTLVDPIIAPNLFYNPNSDDYKSVASIASLIERNATVTEGTDTYDMTLRNFVTLASESVKRTVTLTKTVVLPIVEELTLAAEAKLNEVTGGVGLALNIVPDTKANMLVNPTLVSALEPYVRVAGDDTSTVNVHEPRSSESLVELMRIGYEDFDKEMGEWMAAHVASDLVSSLYNKVFATTSNVVYLSNVFSSGPDNYPEALICFLLARGLTLNPDDNINLTAAEYDAKMALVSNYCAMTIKAGMSRFKSADVNNRVVLRYPAPGQELSYDNPEKGIILVNNEVYNRFLNEGGSPEAIMGSYLMDRKSDSSDLLTNAPKYVSHYNARVMKTRSDAQLRVIISLRKHIETLVSSEIIRTGNKEGEVGVWEGITIDQEAAQLRLRKAIDDIALDDLDDMYGCIRDIILDVFFIDTDAAQLIQLIDANSKGNPEDIKTAVNVAIVDYVVDWFIHQVEIRKF